MVEEVTINPKLHESALTVGGMVDRIIPAINQFKSAWDTFATTGAGQTTEQYVAAAQLLETVDKDVEKLINFVEDIAGEPSGSDNDEEEEGSIAQVKKRVKFSEHESKAKERAATRTAEKEERALERKKKLEEKEEQKKAKAAKAAEEAERKAAEKKQAAAEREAKKAAEKEARLAREEEKAQQRKEREAEKQREKEQREAQIEADKQARDDKRRQKLEERLASIKPKDPSPIAI